MTLESGLDQLKGAQECSSVGCSKDGAADRHQGGRVGDSALTKTERNSGAFATMATT